MRSMTFQNPPSFPQRLRNDLEEICRSKGVTQACKKHTKSPGKKLLDKFFKDELSSMGYSVKSDRLRIAKDSKFDLDLLITGSNWQTAILLEGGKAARVDLDLMKFIAWGESIKSPDCSYAALIASDKKLRRTITGTTNEAVFDYFKRLCPLFRATRPNVSDLLVVEFKS